MLRTLPYLALLALVAPTVVSAQCNTDLTCQYQECRSPASGVPMAVWGELSPADTGTLPGLRDNSDFNEFQDPFDESEPHWMSLDIENGWIFAAINQGMQIWNANPPFQSNPTRVAVRGRNGFPHWIPAASEEKNPVRDVDAPPGEDGVVAFALVDDIGLAVFNTEIKNGPRAVYGDREKQAYAVYSTTLDGTHYAFMATRGHGLLAYDLSAAKARSTSCVEETPGQQGCGVYMGRLGSTANLFYVDGVDQFLVSSGGLFNRGIEIWDVSDVSAPQAVLTALTGDFVYGPAIWRRGSSYYLAVRIQVSGGTQLRIYDLTCLGDGSCTGLGAPIATRSLASGATEFFGTHSVGDGREFLYLGTVNACSQGLQNEWLYEVTDPSNPRDITPTSQLVDGSLTGYWGWYYRRNPTGFNEVTPRMGKFSGTHFYRAAYSIFDIHRIESLAVFADGFESGTLSGWSGAVDDVP